MTAQDPPHVDTHAILVDAPPEDVWSALERYVETIGATGLPLVARILGTEPASGFAVEQREAPRLLALAGRHRFSRYRLVFELEAARGGGTELRAVTYAEFPGLHGAVYRALVIGTRLHVLATRGMLHAVRRSVGQGARTARVPG